MLHERPGEFPLHSDSSDREIRARKTGQRSFGTQSKCCVLAGRMKQAHVDEPEGAGREIIQSVNMGERLLKVGRSRPHIAGHKGGAAPQDKPLGG